MKKKNLFWIMVSAIALIMMTLYILAFGDPLIVTDPENSKFAIEDFEFKHYNTESLQRALSLLLPHGTSLERVDEILVDSGEAEKKKVDYVPSGLGIKAVKVPNAYIYTYREEYPWARDILTLSVYPFHGWSVRVEFDEKNNLKNFWLKTW